MMFFDCNVFIGKPMSMEFPVSTSGAALLAEQAKYGISEAMVCHASAKDGHPNYGNQAVFREIEGCPALHPVWTLLPTATGELAGIYHDPEDLLAAGVRMVRLFPATHGFSLASWSIGGLLAQLEAYRVPVMIDLEETDADALWAMCSGHPRLPVVLTHLSCHSNRRIFPLMQAALNLYLEASSIWANMELEHLCHSFGAGRLLFGSGWPILSIGAAVSCLLQAEITPEEQASIAGKNLRGLLAAVGA